MSELSFEAFPKIARLNRECIISEKIDGTNSQVIVGENGEVAAASRSVTLERDREYKGRVA